MIKPSDVRGVEYKGEVHGLALTGMFRKSEAEYLAAMIAHTLAKLEDEWRALTLEELWPAIEGCGAVRARIIDPIRGRAVLEEDGFIILNAETKTITPTDKFIAKLAERFGT
jgi:hypothetical protein